MQRATWAALLAVLILPASAQATFTEETGGAYDLFGNGPYDVVTADFNRDGRVDVATLNGDSNNLSVLLRRAGAGFDREAGSPFSFGPGAGAGGFGAVADFNGDGWPDVADGFGNTSHVSVLLRQPAGGFALDADSPRGQTSPISAVSAGDFNQDTRPDIVALHYDGSVSILLRNATGDNFVLPQIEFTAGSSPRFVAVADVNGDLDPDLVISNTGTNDVAVYFGGPGGAFVDEGPNVPVGANPFEVVVRDFNADGRPDFAVASCDSDSVSVLLRQPGGGWGPAPGSPVQVGDCPVGLVSDDFNSDGRPDLAVGNQASSNVSVLIGTGGGIFAPDDGSPVRTEQGATALASGDFDADTRPDLAVSNIGAQRVTILLNRTPFPPGPPPVNLDADGDGVQRPTDCNDADASIHPGAKDKPGDKIDQDCNGRDAPFPLGRWGIEAFSATYPSGYTTFTSMKVTKLRRGDRMRLTCKGAGCEMRKKVVRARKKGKLSLLRHLKGAKLRKGAVVQLRITRPRTIGQVGKWKIRAPKTPKATRSCLRPGATKPSRCPR
jgi:hypothetical protein